MSQAAGPACWGCSRVASQQDQAGQPVWNSPHCTGGVRGRRAREGVTIKHGESMARGGLGDLPANKSLGVTPATGRKMSFKEGENIKQKPQFHINCTCAKARQQYLTGVLCTRSQLETSHF